jgi:hypothetical protein
LNADGIPPGLNFFLPQNNGCGPRCSASRPIGVATRPRAPRLAIWRPSPAGTSSIRHRRALARCHTLKHLADTLDHRLADAAVHRNAIEVFTAVVGLGSYPSDGDVTLTPRVARLSEATQNIIAVHGGSFALRPCGDDFSVNRECGHAETSLASDSSMIAAGVPAAMARPPPVAPTVIKLLCASPKFPA